MITSINKKISCTRERNSGISSRRGSQRTKRTDLHFPQISIIKKCSTSVLAEAMMFLLLNTIRFLSSTRVPASLSLRKKRTHTRTCVRTHENPRTHIYTHTPACDIDDELILILGYHVGHQPLPEPQVLNLDAQQTKSRHGLYEKHERLAYHR